MCSCVLDAYLTKQDLWAVAATSVLEQLRGHTLCQTLVPKPCTDVAMQLSSHS